MGIKELCNTCKNKNREQVNNTSLTNNKDLSNQDLSTEDINDNDTEQSNNAPLHLLTVPSEASRSTTEKIRSSAPRINTGRFVTKDVSVFSEKSCTACLSCAYVNDIFCSLYYCYISDHATVVSALIH